MPFFFNATLFTIPFIKDFSTIHIGHFLASLKSVSSTLTLLDIDMEGGPMIGIPEVLSACPNLVTLNICEAYEADVSSLCISPWSTLTTLSLIFTYTHITCDQTIEIWKRFPSLKKLELAPCSNTQSALVVSEYYPRMKKLHLCMEGSGICLTYSDEGNHDTQETGVTKLIIGNRRFGRRDLQGHDLYRKAIP